ncbi:MAG: DUF72 domain-containing protein [Planctomycetes bacterium]|nr:DUF72 domain-containing protein [Planctomycetota bacterium]
MGGAPGKLWIGPSGWSYPDWHGVVYPAEARGLKPLTYLAGYFNAVEVNTSFYAIPRTATTASWPGQVPADFRFAFKLLRGFTHESVSRPDPAMVRNFKESVQPIREAGKLGPILFQFPWSFHYSPQTAERLRHLAEAFSEFDRCIEVRHTSWLRPEALELLRTLGGFCNIDQPLLRACIEPQRLVFGDTAYVRFHGRNKLNWFARNIPSYERYNYMYSEDELREWVARINGMLAEARDAYVFTNNHYRGQAVANALQLRAMLAGASVRMPPTLARTYPHLASFAVAEEVASVSANAAPTLFDPPR